MTTRVIGYNCRNQWKKLTGAVDLGESLSGLGCNAHVILSAELPCLSASLMATFLINVHC